MTPVYALVGAERAIGFLDSYSDTRGTDGRGRDVLAVDARVSQRTAEPNDGDIGSCINDTSA